MSDRRGTLGVVVAGAVVLVAAVLLTLAWAGEDRRFVASTPQPPPLYETDLVPVRPGGRACWKDVTVVPRGDVAQFRVTTKGRPPVPLVFRLDAPGYQAVARVAPTYRDNDLLSVRITPPTRPVFARACVRNRGDRRIALYAADDQSPTLDANIDGEDGDDIPALSFVESAPDDVGSRAGTIAEEVGFFRPGFVDPWLVWLLAGLVVVGLPVGIVLTLVRALRDDR